MSASKAALSETGDKLAAAEKATKDAKGARV
jgi:hypothetical protein